MKYRKRLVLFLAALTFISLGITQTILAAKITLKMWIHSNPRYVAFQEEMVSKFEKIEPNVKIETEVFPYSNLRDKVVAGFVAEMEPDLLEVPSIWVIFPAATGKLNPIPSDVLTPQELKEKFYQSSLERAAWEENGRTIYYGIPANVNIDWGPAVVVNKDMLDKAGIKKDWVEWDDFIRDAQKLTIKDSAGKLIRSGWEITTAASGPMAFNTFLYQLGGKVYNEDNTVAFDSPIGRKALTMLNDIVNKYEIDSVELGATAALGMGTAAMDHWGSWLTASYEDDFPDLNWEYVRIPTLGSEFPWFDCWDVWGWYVTSKCEYKEMGWEFMKLRLENAAQFGLTTYELPAYIPAALSPKIATDRRFVTWVPLVPYQKTPFHGMGVEEIRKAMEDMLVGVWLEKYSVDEAITIAAEKINAIRTRYGEIR